MRRGTAPIHIRPSRPVNEGTLASDQHARCISSVRPLGLASKWRDALPLLSEMSCSRLQPSVVLFSSLVSACAQGTAWSEALGLLAEVYNGAIEANTIVQNALINAFARSDRWHLAFHVLERMRSGSVEADAITCSTAIRARERRAPDGSTPINMVQFRSSWARLILLLANMYQRAFRPSANIINAAVRTAEEDGCWPLAMCLLKDIGRRTVEPDAPAFSAAIRACARSAVAVKACDLLASMYWEAVRTDTFTFSAAVSACGSDKHWIRAFALLAEMQRSTVVADLVVYSAAIRACAEGQLWEFAVQLFGEIHRRRLPADLIVYSDSISTMAAAQRWVEALLLLSMMDNGHLEKSLIVLNAAMSACEKGEHWEHALFVMHMIQEHRMQANVITFNTAISAAEKGAEWTIAFSLLGEMQEHTIRLDRITMNAAISSCEKCHEWTHALQLLRITSIHRQVLDAISGSSSVLACSRSVHWRVAEHLLDAMCHQTIQPDMALYSPLLMEGEQRCQPGYHAALVTRATCSVDSECLRNAGASAVALRWMGRGADASMLQRVQHLATMHTFSPVWQMLGLPQPVPKTRTIRSTASFQLELFKTNSVYAKELALLQYVFSVASSGDVASVCWAIESFGKDVLRPASLWLKVAGGGKSNILDASVRSAPAGGIVLEFGTYCGYSSVRLCQSFPHVSMVSLEVDPVHMVIATNIVALAGLSRRIDVWTGHSKDVLPRLSDQYGRCAFAAAFLDHRGSLFHTDLCLLEQNSLLRAGTVVIADNVLKPGAPLFLWRVAAGSRYASQIVSVGEFLMPAEDWMSVSVQGLSGTQVLEVAGDRLFDVQPPGSLLRLHDESDRARRKAQGPDTSVSFEEWAAFALAMQDGMALAGIDVTVRWCTADEPETPRHQNRLAIPSSQLRHTRHA